MKKSLVITSIASDQHPVLRQYAAECCKRGIDFILIGDKSSPKDFYIENCDFWSLEGQKDLSFRIAELLPERHYSRKNLGYLLAMQSGSSQIIETDDDNIPLENFWQEKQREVPARHISTEGWVNVYRFFSHEHIWPRGFPLEEAQKQHSNDAWTEKIVCSPIHQGLSDSNPDVDAVFRLTNPAEFFFRKDMPVSLGRNASCPFNSQNTVWFKEAFALLYLPSYCSFRMTDIWRSFVAQRIAWDNGWSITFHCASTHQERNEHNIMKDFELEIPGYLHNNRICLMMQQLTLLPGEENIGENMLRCYEIFVREGLIAEKELNLLDAWLEDVRNCLRLEISVQKVTLA